MHSVQQVTYFPEDLFDSSRNRSLAYLMATLEEISVTCHAFLHAVPPPPVAPPFLFEPSYDQSRFWEAFL